MLASPTHAEIVRYSNPALAHFSRIPNDRNRGRVLPPPPSVAAPPSTGPLDPLSIVSSTSPFFFLSGDLGITIGTGVSAWGDQTGNGRNATQGTAAAQPAYSASDSDFGGRGALSGDGVDDMLTVAWDPPAPLTTNVWFFAVLLQRTYTAGEYIMAGGNQILAIAQTPSTPAIRQLNTTAVNANNGATVGVAARVEALFSGSTSDYIKCGAAAITTGGNAGNSDATTFALFNRPGGTGYFDGKIACIGAWAGLPTVGERSALSAWVTAWYGGGVLV